MIVYCTTNIKNYRKYIGRDKHNNPNYLGSGSEFKKDLKLYGKENFKKQILEYCSSFEEMIEAEDYWIEYYQAYKSDLFYNICKRSGRGYDIRFHPNKEDIIKRQVESHKKTLQENPEIRRKQNIALKQTYIDHPEIQINWMKKRKQTYNNNPEIYKRQAATLKQTYLNHPEILLRISNTVKKTTNNPEWKLKHIENCKRSIEKRRKLLGGSAITEETRKKMKLAKLRRPLIICPHCNYQGYNKGSIVRVHFDNCKHKLRNND